LPDWLVERGIGESRAVQIKAGEIVEARILLDGMVRAGSRLTARLKRSGRPAVAQSGGEEFLMPSGAPGVTEGAALVIEVTREAIPGGEPWKRPLARLSADGPALAPEPSGEALPFPSPTDRLADAGWWELIDEARSGIVRFPGGELRISVTPAMTLIDVDGHLPLAELALAGAEAAARVIPRLDIGGSVGIDFPTINGKAERQAVAERIDMLLPKPFERTAMNGFGFLQIVRPRLRASLVELAADRPSFEARVLLRKTACETPGAKRLVAHPSIVTLLERRADWLQTLSVQVGGPISLRAEAQLPISAAYAEPA
jgi:hypothetical protein